MEVTLRLPTADPYAFIEVKSEVENIQDAVDAYHVSMNLLKGGEGLPDKEMVTFIRNMIENNGNLGTQFEKLSAEQNQWRNKIQRAINQINYKIKKEVEEVNLEAKSRSELLLE